MSEAAAHSAGRAAADVEAHAEADGIPMHLLAEIGHRRGRQPLNVSPSNVRSTNRPRQVGAIAASSINAADASSDSDMIALRPHASDTAPANSTATAITPLGSESESALPAALTPYSRLNSGINGCTQYSNPNVATPAAEHGQIRPPKGGRAVAYESAGAHGPAADSRSPHTRASRRA